MRYIGLAVLIPAPLVACNEYGYRYRPHPQVLYCPVLADFHEQDHGIEILLVDTDELRLQLLEIVKSDETVVNPTGIDYPHLKPKLMSGIREDIYGPDLAGGPTVASFDKYDIGPRPWNIRLNIQDVPPAMIQIRG